jgi:hypothetical protein
VVAMKDNFYETLPHDKTRSARGILN